MIVNFKLRSSRAYSLLEYAAVLPIFLFFIIGAVDITNLMRGYTALQAGVDKTLRCLYPTDAACVEASPDTRNRLFEVVYHDNREITYVPEMAYSGTASWLEQPVNTYERAEAVILNQVSYDAPPMKAVLKDQLVSNPSGKVNYLIQLFSEPYISGNALDPNFGSDQTNGHSDDYPSEAKTSINISSVNLKSEIDPTTNTQASSSVLSGNSPSYTIERPVDGKIRCFLSKNFNKSPKKSAPVADLTESCSLDDDVQVVFHIAGDIANSDPGATGSVEISLCTSGGGCQSLGGRQIDSNPGSSGNFAARGFSCTQSKSGKLNCPRVDQNVIDSYPKEAALHNTLSVPWNTPFYFKFSVQHGSGNRIGWRGEQIRIFWPLYTKVKEDANCLNPMTKSELKKDGACCPSDHPTGLKACNLKIGGQLQDFEVDSVTIPCGKKIAEVPAYLTSLGKKNPAKYQTELRQAERCPATSRTVDCPANNLGILEAPQDLTQLVCNSSEAARECPVNDSDWANFASSPTNPCWSRKTIALSFPKFEYAIKNCQSIEPPKEIWPSEISRYNNAKLLPAISNKTTKLCTLPISDQETPYNISRDNPLYNCGIFTARSFTYDHNASPSLPSDSLFKGRQEHLGCDWQDKLKKHAQSFNDPNLKLATGCYFDAQARMIGRKKAEHAPDSCTPVEYEVSESVKHTPLGIYPENNFPALCQTAQHSCTAKFKGYSNDGLKAGTQLLGDKAANSYGIPEILSTYPNAIFQSEGCAGALCARLSTSQLEGEQPRVEAHAKLNVPLYLGKLFGNEFVEITYRDQVKLERAFSNLN